MDQEELERFAQEFEAESKSQDTSSGTPTADIASVPMVEQSKEVQNGGASFLSVNGVVGGIQQEILGRAQHKISQEKILDKHADDIAKVTDKAMAVDIERTSLQVQEKEADNKVKKQEIKNKLIVLKAEAERLEKEQKQLNKEQKADHKARNKQAKWEMYKGKLQKMGYSYVPNIVILSMLLFFDGIKSFFNGVEAVSTAALKALKWVLLIGAILIVLFAIPVTREWLTNLLSGGH